MAVKTFTTGEVLTASDTNTYLNNGGLVYITDTSWSGVSSASQVTVSNVFSSTYDNYRILITGYGNTSSGVLSMKLRTTTDDSTAAYARYGSSWATSASNITESGQTMWRINLFSNNSAYRDSLDMTVFNPNVATNTGAVGHALELNTGIYYAYSLNMQTTTQYTGFSLFISTGTFTGKVWVYGFRQA